MTHFLRFLFLAAAIAGGASNGYHVVGRIKVGGEGGWDYLTVDSAARRLYVSHATHVAVIDLDAGKVAGDIPDTPGVHGIAVAPELGRGFTSNGRSNNVTIFDLKTLKPAGQVATGQNPDSIRYDSVSGRVFTFNGRSNDSTAINAKTGAVEGTIALGGKPEFSVADGKGKVYVNIEDTSEIAEIDARALSVTKRYSLAPCDGPSGLALDAAHRRLFSVCGNRMMVVSDPDSGKVVANVPIGPGCDGAAFDPDRGLAFSSNGGDGTMTVVRQVAGKYEVQENVPTQRGARTMTIDPATHKVYLPTAEYGAPAAGAPQRGRAPAVPDSFMVLVLEQ
jgi:hypothetical protein